MKVNKKTLADIIGYSEKTLTDWQAHGMPILLSAGRGSSNEYDTAAVIGWMLDRQALGNKRESAKDRLDRLRGDQLERELAKEDGLLVTPEDLDIEYDGLVEAVRAELLFNVPQELAGELSAVYGADIDVSIISRHIEDALRKLSTYDPGVDQDPESGDAPADEEEREAMG